MSGFRLYGYFRSGAAHRVRIALELKRIEYEYCAVHLLRDGGEQHAPAYCSINPQRRVPALMLPCGEVLIQSPAILDYLEETTPLPPLLPADPIMRAKVRGVAAVIGCDTHPLNNLGVLNTLRRLGCDKDEVSAWTVQWIRTGFDAVEQLIGDEAWCFGNTPGLADIYLIPQIFSARRFGVTLEPYPRIAAIERLAAQHPAFIRAEPSRQPDAE